MSETPLGPTPVRDVLLRQGAILGGRGKLGFLAAAAVLLGAVVVIVYFIVFPIPRPAGAGHARPGPPLDQSALGVANTFTKLAWDEHNCRAAGRYSLGLRHCASGLLPAGTHVTVNTWLIQPHCTGARALPVSRFAGRLVSGCIQYLAGNGETLTYTMAKVPRGWRVVAVAARHSSP